MKPSFTFKQLAEGGLDDSGGLKLGVFQLPLRVVGWDLNPSTCRERRGGEAQSSITQFMGEVGGGSPYFLQFCGKAHTLLEVKLMGGVARPTFATVLIGNTLRAYIDDSASATTGQAGIEHARIFLELLVGVATEGLAALDQDCLVELMVEAHHWESATMSE